MSEEKLWNNARRWFNQAASDLEAADVLLTGEKYAQAAFWSQQAAEKAMKAVWIVLDRDPWGHSVARLIRDLSSEEAGLLMLSRYPIGKRLVPLRVGWRPEYGDRRGP